MAIHSKLLWCPPVVARLCVIILGFALFLSITNTVRPRTSQAASPQDATGLAAAPASGTGQPGLGIGSPARDPRAVYPNPAPLASQSAPGTARGPGADGAASLAMAPRRDAQGNVLIGALVGSDYAIWVYSSAAGPQYTVADRSGRVLASGLGATQVFERFPQIPVTELRMQPTDPSMGEPLMLVDPSK